MTRKIRGATVFALGAAVALLASACSSGDNDSGSDASSTGGGSGEKVTLTLWENNTTGDGPQFWADTIEAFKAVNPDVTIKLQPVQNEDLDGKLQTALNGGDAPDVFLQRGGGKLKDMVDAGFVADITDAISDEAKAAIPEGIFGADTLDGKVYAMPLTIMPGGMFYSKDLFTQAGITTPPKTLEEFNDAVAKLKTAGIAPIALGAKDAWPAAHWFYWFSLRECSSEALEKAANDQNLSDPCFLKAGEDVKTFAATTPFNEGFLTTSAQQGASSSAGLIANHKAAMELMGAWDPGVIKSLTPDQQDLPDLGFFPFPEITGGAGEAGSMMAGVDAFSCSAKAPQPACTDFLNFLATKEIQENYSVAAGSPPASSEATGVVTLPALKEVVAAYSESPYVSLWLDTRLGQNIGNALNTGVVDLLAGKGSPQGIIDAANNAAAKG